MKKLTDLLNWSNISLLMGKSRNTLTPRTLTKKNFEAVDTFIYKTLPEIWEKFKSEKS